MSPLATRIIAGVLLGLAVWLWPAAWRLLAPALSPYLAVCSGIALRSLSAASALALPMLLLAIVRRRFWCRRLCPVGLISESCGKARLGRARRNRVNGWPPGRFIALATLGGALAGYPLFLWMDPLALFSGAFGIARAAQPGVSVLAAAGLPLVMLISVLFPGAWCSRICPLGATQDLLAYLKGNGRTAPADLAARRVLVTLGAGTLFSALVPWAWAKRPHPLRPPGSVGETAFKGACIRCGSCARACPARIIKPGASADDAAGFLAPTLEFGGRDYCRQDCNRCGEVCPTGVIRRLPLEEKNRQAIGIASIDLSRCLLTQEVECGVCIPRCPRGAIVDDFNRAAYTASVRVVPEKCNGCGACVGICPPKVVKVVAQVDRLQQVTGVDVPS